MKILTKYLIKEFFKLLLITQSVFITIYLIVDFLQKIDNFMEAHATKGAMLAYFLYKTPYVGIQMIPVATLISVILMFCLMKKNNELIALKASGMSVLKISLPVIYVSAGLTIAVFIISELIVPYASSKSQSVWYSAVKKKSHKRLYERSHIWYKGTNSIYGIQHFNEKQMIMHKPALYFFDDTFHLTKRIQAQKAVWSENKWILKQGIIQTPLPGGGYNLKKFEALQADIPETPETFLKPVKRPEEMSYWQLKRFAETVRLEGYDVTKYLVEMNIKLSFPVINLVMALIGIPIALRINKGGTAFAVTVGVGACFCYLVTLGITRSLGISGIMPPEFSAWLANIIFFLLSVYLITRIET